MHDPDAAQFLADALSIELTDAQRAILTDAHGHRLTLGKPVPIDRPHDLAQSQRPRGSDAHTVIFDEPNDARVAAYWGTDTDWDAPADGEGNPLPDPIRRELTREQDRIDAYFRSGGLTTL